MKKISLCVLFMFCLACRPSSDNNNAPQAVIVNQKLKDCINSFAGQLTNKGEKQKIIMIHAENAGDTTFITIIHSIPDIKKTKINGILNINGYSIYLTGTLVQTLYKVNPKKVYAFDPVVFNKRTIKISDLEYIEPLQWNITFVGDSLLNQYR